MKRSDAVLKRRVRRSYLVSTVSIALVLFLLGAVGYIMLSIFTTAAKMREGVTMIVELRDGLSETERDSVAAQLARSEMVADIRFSPREEKAADEEFRRSFGDAADILLEDNPLPDSFDVVLSQRSADSESLGRWADECSAIEGVERVTYPAMFLSKMHSILDTMQIILLLFGGAMLAISLILLNNTVRLAIFSRRQIINTMKLVGATKWFIMRSFVGRSAIQGLVAGVAATLLFAAAFYGLDAGIPELGIASQLRILAVIAAGMILVGEVVAILFTVFAVNKFVNMKSNKIYLY